MDLYIFGLVTNDLVYNQDNRFNTNTNLIDKLKIKCPGPAVYTLEDTGKNIPPVYWSKTLETTSQNYCAFEQIAPLFPKEKTIYINLSDKVLHYDDPFEEKFSQLTSKYFSRIIVPNYHKEPSALRVSQKECHPSVYTHQIYANTLFQEITTNPEWGFIKL